MLSFEGSCVTILSIGPIVPNSELALSYLYDCNIMTKRSQSISLQSQSDQEIDFEEAVEKFLFG